MKVSKQASSKADTVSERSDKNKLASETYRKVKEVEYRKEVIYDKNGMVIEYDDNPKEYRKARKRIQNRESAIRSRYRKKQYFTEIEVRVEQLEEENKRLVTENATLKAEKRLMRDQLEYFKVLVGNMNHTISTKVSSFHNSRDTSSQGESYDEEKDIIVHPDYDVKAGELPHIGNYKRPLNGRRNKPEEDDERLVLSRKDEGTAASTAGLFFLAIIMCVLCFTSLTLTGNGQTQEANKKEFSLENPSRHMMAIQKKHEEDTSFLRVMMWMIFLLSVIVAYFSKITLKEGKFIIQKVLIKCRIIKDTTKKAKYS